MKEQKGGQRVKDNDRGIHDRESLLNLIFFFFFFFLEVAIVHLILYFSEGEAGRSVTGKSCRSCAARPCATAVVGCVQ